MNTEKYNEYQRVYQNKKYHQRRKEWIGKLGGNCVNCGSTENLEFDHKDAASKEYDISKILNSHSEVKVAYEMAKCQLLCNGCHLEKSLREGDIPNVVHGGGLSGKKNCPCELCKAKKAAYMYTKNYRNVKTRKPKRPYICGEYRTYKHGCKCDDCKAANSLYMRNLRGQ